MKLLKSKKSLQVYESIQKLSNSNSYLTFQIIFLFKIFIGLFDSQSLRENTKERSSTNWMAPQRDQWPGIDQARTESGFSIWVCSYLGCSGPGAWSFFLFFHRIISQELDFKCSISRAAAEYSNCPTCLWDLPTLVGNMQTYPNVKLYIYIICCINVLTLHCAKCNDVCFLRNNHRDWHVEDT